MLASSSSSDLSTSTPLLINSMREAFESRLVGIFEAVRTAAGESSSSGGIANALDSALLRERDSALSTMAASAARARVEVDASTVAVRDSLRERDLTASELRDVTRERDRISAELMWERTQRVAEAQRASNAEAKALEAVSYFSFTLLIQ
jgi:hypothetical protein